MQRHETALAVGIPEAARRLGLSARTIATLIARRELPSRRVGRRRIIPIAALEAFIQRDHPTHEKKAAKRSDSRPVSKRV